jgi:BASS family bile acid:Na+ symporter
VVVVLSIVVQTWDDLPNFFGQMGLAMLTLNVTTMLLGYAIARLIRLDRPSAKAITAEVGIQGVGLAIAIASTSTMLNQPIMSIPAVVLWAADVCHGRGVCGGHGASVAHAQGLGR